MTIEVKERKKKKNKEIRRRKVTQFRLNHHTSYANRADNSFIQVYIFVLLVHSGILFKQEQH